MSPDVKPSYPRGQAGLIMAGLHGPLSCGRATPPRPAAPVPAVPRGGSEAAGDGR
jgi:hypothetical protein